MTYFRSEQKRSRLRRELLAAFCVNRSGRIKEKALHIADIQGFLLSIGVSFWLPLERKTGLALALRASVFPRTAVDTPGPWKGRIEVAGDEGPFSSHISTRKGEPFWFSLLLWSGKRDSHSRCARVCSRERLLTPPAPGRGALRSRGTGPPLKTQSNRENL